MTSASLNAYRSHELSIDMRTSSGDKFSLNFENEQSLSLSSKQDDNAKEAKFSFSSMQAFSFTLDTNGISEQDQKEIDTFMEKAQPYIDKFMKELEEQNQHSPVNKIASDILKNIGNLKNSNEVVKNNTKNEIVNAFDNAVQSAKTTQEMFDEAQKLLEKIIKSFDSIFEPLYA